MSWSFSECGYSVSWLFSECSYSVSVVFMKWLFSECGMCGEGGGRGGEVTHRLYSQL